MKAVLILIRWCAGIFFCMVALVGLLSGDFLAGLFILSLGLILLPPVTKFLSGKNTLEQKPPQIISSNIQPRLVPITNSHLPQQNTDESIIDVTGKSVSIPISPAEPKERLVTYWSHTYIYSYDDIRYATKAQTDFYHYFKQQFLNGKYINLQGNNNYAFILLFDLLRQEHDMPGLEKNLRILRQEYPKTRPYALPFFAQKLAKRGDTVNEDRIRQEIYDESNSSRLGTRYKKILQLDRASEELLNKLWYPGNNFYDIPFCQQQIITLFHKVIVNLQSVYAAAQQTIDLQFSAAADVIVRKQYRYRQGSDNYKYCIQSSITEFYILILKHCENAIRERYEHKRKLSIDTYTISEVNNAVEDLILSKVKEIISKEIAHVVPPDEATEIELNAQNTTRWKSRLKQLENELQAKDGRQFLKEVELLGKLNKKNPSIEHIFFESSKIISRSDRGVALILYIQYISYDLISATFDNKPLPKTLQKALFDNEEQAATFDNIISTFIKNRNVEQALAEVKQLYLPKRKKITLDRTSITETSRKHKDTVERLTWLLQDDEIVVQDIQQDDYKAFDNIITTAPDTLNLNQDQKGLMKLFEKHSYCLPKSELSNYARSAGIFPDQLIESINETCYDIIDDLLIEEEDAVYIINENKYKTIFLT